MIIVDDHSMVREGLKQLLELEGDIEVIDEAKDGIECLEKLEKNIPDILLLDINMPKMNGLEVLKIIKEKMIKVKIIILTVHNEVEYLMKALNIGIDGYMLKDSDSTELRKAIFTVLNGESFIQPSMIPYLNKKIIEKDDEKMKMEELTKREIEVLKLLTIGLLNKEIATQLNISERTVKNHISNIFKKLDVSDRTQAAVFAIRNNLVNVF